MYYVGKGCMRELGSHLFDRMDDHEQDAKCPLLKGIQHKQRSHLPCLLLCKKTIKITRLYFLERMNERGN